MSRKNRLAVVFVLVSSVIIPFQTFAGTALVFGATTQGGAVIEGTVIDTRTGKGLPGVSVELTLAPRPPGDVTRAVTDAAGRFMLIGLSRGRYRLTASKTGYANADIEDPLRSTGAIIAVASDQRIEDVRVPLVPTSALSGRVIDQQGQAMSGVRVILLQPSYSPNGEVVLQPIGRALTDDSGNYRLSDLVPGRYHLLAIGTTELSMVPTYYPGVSAADASVPLTMLPGIHVSNLEARLFGGERYSIGMRLVSAAPLPDDLRFIVRERGDVFIPTFLALRTDPSQDGHYVVSGIPPGRYRLELVSDVPSQAMRQVIDVDIFNQDIDLGTIPIDTPTSITGRVILEVDAPLPPAISLFPLSMSNGLIATSRIHEDGTFALDRVSDGRYSVLLPSLPSTGYIRSIRLDGTESLRTGGRRWGEASGNAGSFCRRSGGES